MENKTIKLPCYNIEITLDDTKIGFGTIESNLRSEERIEITDNDDYQEFVIALDAIESLILAHAVAGIDVTTPAYIEGIETSIDAILNHLT